MIWSRWSQTHSCFFVILYRKLKVDQGQDQPKRYPTPSHPLRVSFPPRTRPYQVTYDLNPDCISQQGRVAVFFLVIETELHTA